MSNVHHLFDAENQSYWNELYSTRDRVSKLSRIQGYGRRFLGTDLPFKIIQLDASRPDGYLQKDMLKALNITSVHLCQWKKLQNKGMLVGGGKITHI